MSHDYSVHELWLIQEMFEEHKRGIYVLSDKDFEYLIAFSRAHQRFAGSFAEREELLALVRHYRREIRRPYVQPKEDILPLRGNM